MRSYEDNDIFALKQKIIADFIEYILHVYFRVFVYSFGRSFALVLIVCENESI